MASTDNITTLKEFALKNQAQFPILSDPGGKTAAKYGVLSRGYFASRTTFIIDKDGKIIHINRNVDPFSAGPDLYLTLKNLEKGNNR